MDDKSLRKTIIAQLDWEPSVDSADIGVAVDDGLVTLTGHVPNYFQKTTAENVVKRVKGVRGIAQKLEVRYDGAAPNDDEEIARRCIALLDFDVVTPHDALQVKVSHGWVTLSGQVDWQFQGRAAEDALRKVYGVTGITNLVTVKPHASAPDISRRIEDALRRDATLEAKNIKVAAIGGRVVLNGSVDCLHDRDLAEQAAWAAPGVTSVEDHLHIA